VVALIFLLLIDLLFLWSALYPWITEPEFGWSLPARQGSLILGFLILSTVLLAASVVHRSDAKGRKALFVALLSIVTLLLGAFVASYDPVEGWLTPSQLAEMGVTESYYSALAPCKQVTVMAELGYNRIDWEHELVLLPDWMEGYLQANPKTTLADCFEREIRSQMVWLKGDNRPREVATKKIYALYLEADELDVLWPSPSLMDLEKFLICQRKIDVNGVLSLQYYSARQHAVPNYDYLSSAGRQRLQVEVCQH
jgi:hypothetical protein